MKLKGSCHCRSVKFSVDSEHYYPYQLCYCSIYRAKVKNPGERSYQSSGERNFCKVCSSGLWLYDPNWPELIHPFASAIDTPLPIAPEHTHLMLDFKASWVELHKLGKDKTFKCYPKESLAEWHERVIYDTL